MWFRSVQNIQVLSHTKLSKPFLTDLTVLKFTKLLGLVSLCLVRLRLSVIGAAEIVTSILLISVWSVCERFPVLFLISSSPQSSSLHNRAHLISRRGWRVCGTFGPGCSSHSCLMLKRNHRRLGINMTDLDRQPCGLSNFAVNVTKKCFRQTQLHDEIVCPHAWITRRWELEPVEPN